MESMQTYKGCCISVISAREIYPRLSICINVSGTHMPVKEPEKTSVEPLGPCVMVHFTLRKLHVSAVTSHRSNLSAMKNKVNKYNIL